MAKKQLSKSKSSKNISAKSFSKEFGNKMANANKKRIEKKNILKKNCDNKGVEIEKSYRKTLLQNVDSFDNIKFPKHIEKEFDEFAHISKSKYETRKGLTIASRKGQFNVNKEDKIILENGKPKTIKGKWKVDKMVNCESTYSGEKLTNRECLSDIQSNIQVLNDFNKAKSKKERMNFYE